MYKRLIIILSFLFGIFSFPTLFRKPTFKLWLPFFLFNGLINYIFDKSLVKKKKVKYPVRFMPKTFKINVLYDFFVCPYITTWFCQATYNSKFAGIIGKLLLFSIPQGIYEIILERKTNSLKFKGNWRWFYSLFLVFVVKIFSRTLLSIIKRIFLKEKSKEGIS